MDSLASSRNLPPPQTSAETRGFLHGPITAHFPIKTVETLRSKNGEGNGNVKSLGRAGLRSVGVPAKIDAYRIVFFETMPKFRDTILLAHASRLINAEEFVLLYDLRKPKNPDLHIPFAYICKDLFEELD